MMVGAVEEISVGKYLFMWLVLCFSFWFMANPIPIEESLMAGIKIGTFLSYAACITLSVTPCAFDIHLPVNSMNSLLE